MVSLQVRFFTSAEKRFLFCRGTGSLPVLVGASFAVQKGDPFHQFSNRFGIASGFDVAVIVFSLSLGIY